MAGNRNSGVMAIEPLLICHGAEHDLKLAAVEGSPWINQGASLNPTLGGTSPISSEPEIGQYQPLLADGAEWKLICPAEGSDIDFNLQVQSEFTAVPYQLPFKLGDYRRKILKERNPISAPVVGDEVSAEIQVVSFYTEKELEGVDVDWYFDGTIVCTVQTTGLGWSKFDHAVTEVGEHTITAKVYSPYNDTTSEHTFTLNVYLESPWEQATLLINGEPVAWNSPGAFLFRGQPNEVKVEAPFLRGKEVALDLINSDGLDIEASPEFKEWVSTPDAKASWALAANGTKSGRIKLKLLSNDVIQAWEIPCAVLSANLAEEADVEIESAPVPNDGNWFIRDKPQTVTLKLKPGSPLRGLPVTLSLEVINGLDRENVRSEPDFGCEDTSYSWAVTGNTKSGEFQLSLKGTGMTAAITVAVSKLISNDLAEEVTVKIGGQDVPSGGNVFFRGQSKDVVVTPKPGSPIAGYPIALACTVNEPLQLTDLSSRPPFNDSNPTYEWDVTGANNSGFFQLQIVAKDMTPINVIASKLLSTDLNDEGEVWIGWENVSSRGSVFFRGQPRDVELKPRPGSPIEGHPISLTRKVNNPLEHNDLSSSPRFDPFEPTLKWSVTGANRSGFFQLELTAEGMATPITVTGNKLLSTRLADEVDVKIGEKEVTFGGGVFFKGRAKVVKLLPKLLGSPIEGHPIALTRTTEIPLSMGDLSSIPLFSRFLPTLEWEVTGANKSGIFHLHVTGEGMATRINITPNKLLSTNLTDEATPLFNGRAIPADEVFGGGVTKVLTLDYKSSLLSDVPLRLNWVPKPGLVINDVSSTPPRNSDTTTHSWDIVCAKNKTGIFDLELSAGDNNEAKLLIPGNRLFPKAVIFRFLNTDGEYHPLPPETIVANRGWGYFVGVRLLTMDGLPLPDKRVTFRIPEHPPSEGRTSEAGYARSPLGVLFRNLGIFEVYAEFNIEGRVESVSMLVEVKDISLSE
jgi:hypothetical protein